MLQSGDKILFSNFEIEWENIKYKDQKSLFDTFTNKKTEYTFGHLKNDKPETEFLLYDIKDFINEWNIKGKGHFLPLFAIGSKNNHDQYLLYKRKKELIENYLLYP